MKSTKTTEYFAATEAAYNELATFAITLPATVTLHPGLNTIVAPESADTSLKFFIENNGLDIHINHPDVSDANLNEVIDSETTGADTLRNIIYRMMGEKEAMTETINDLKKSRDLYQKWYDEATDKAARVKSQIGAISTLMSTIFKED